MSIALLSRTVAAGGGSGVGPLSEKRVRTWGSPALHLRQKPRSHTTDAARLKGLLGWHVVMGMQSGGGGGGREPPGGTAD